MNVKVHLLFLFLSNLLKAFALKPSHSFLTNAIQLSKSTKVHRRTYGDEVAESYSLDTRVLFFSRRVLSVRTVNSPSLVSLRHIKHFILYIVLYTPDTINDNEDIVE